MKYELFLKLILFTKCAKNLNVEINKKLKITKIKKIIKCAFVLCVFRGSEPLQFLEPVSFSMISLLWNILLPDAGSASTFIN
jgi:hypothetical protein